MESGSLINILIRTSNRQALFARCIKSIRDQTYKNVKIIVGFDSCQATYLHDYDDIENVAVYKSVDRPFYYDLYCNDLVTHVKNGWFFFLDDDDFLHSPNVLEKLSYYFTGNHDAIICQFLRNGLPKPSRSYIKNGIVRDGHIGLPSLILKAEHANLLHLDGYKSGDYRAILNITQKVRTKFIELVVVETDRRSHGNMELSEKIENIG